MIVIPAIDIIDGKIVRLTEGDYNRTTFYGMEPEEMVKRYVDNGFSRIHAVDLDGAKNSKPINLRVLEKMSKVDEAQVEWSGGIKTIQDAIDARNAGADFLSLGSMAVKNPELFVEMLSRFGTETIILSADVRNGRVAVKGWLEDTRETVNQLVEQFIPNGLSQAIVTDIRKDGTFGGVDIDFYIKLQNLYPSIAFTVSGGIGSINDVRKVAEAGLKRVIVGKAIYENKVTLEQLKEYNQLCWQKE